MAILIPSSGKGAHAQQLRCQVLKAPTCASWGTGLAGWNCPIGYGRGVQSGPELKRGMWVRVMQLQRQILSLFCSSWVFSISLEFLKILH